MGRKHRRRTRSPRAGPRLEADGGRFGGAGLAAAQEWLTVEIEGQADIARNLLGQPRIAERIHEQAARVRDAGTVAEAMGFEGRAAELYWAAWTGTVAVPCSGGDAEHVPAHWPVFTQRESHVVSSPRHATDPVNALLNFAYRIAGTECRLALLHHGLDPRMGFLRTDRDDRDSLALDLLEAIRSAVGQFVLGLLGYGCPAREFDRFAFAETREGVCRLVAPLTRDRRAGRGMWRTLPSPTPRACAGPLAALADRQVPATPRTTAARKRGAAKRPGTPKREGTRRRVMPGPVDASPPVNTTSPIPAVAGTPTATDAVPAAVRRTVAPRLPKHTRTSGSGPRSPSPARSSLPPLCTRYSVSRSDTCPPRSASPAAP